MKLGTQTASLTNHIYSRSVIGQPEPFVGMGCTVLGWTDRHAATIVEIDAKGRVKVQQDKATRADKNGMSEQQEYTYAADENGAISWFQKDAAGRWSELFLNERTGRLNKIKGGKGLMIGERCEYYDFSF